MVETPNGVPVEQEVALGLFHLSKGPEMTTNSEAPARSMTTSEASGTPAGDPPGAPPGAVSGDGADMANNNADLNQGVPGAHMGGAVTGVPVPTNASTGSTGTANVKEEPMTLPSATTNTNTSIMPIPVNVAGGTNPMIAAASPATVAAVANLPSATNPNVPMPPRGIDPPANPMTTHNPNDLNVNGAPNGNPGVPMTSGLNASVNVNVNPTHVIPRVEWATIPNMAGQPAGAGTGVGAVNVSNSSRPDPPLLAPAVVMAGPPPLPPGTHQPGTHQPMPPILLQVEVPVAPPPDIKIQITSPHHHDILSGRGNGANQHPGNIYFRNLITKNKYQYIHTGPSEKKLITKRIVAAIATRNPPGRFLKQNPQTELWEELDTEKVLKKTGQALREKAPELKRKSLELASAHLSSEYLAVNGPRGGNGSSSGGGGVGGPRLPKKAKLTNDASHFPWGGAQMPDLSKYGAAAYGMQAASAMPPLGGAVGGGAAPGPMMGGIPRPLHGVGGYPIDPPGHRAGMGSTGEGSPVMSSPAMNPVKMVESIPNPKLNGLMNMSKSSCRVQYPAADAKYYIDVDPMEYKKAFCQALVGAEGDLTKIYNFVMKNKQIFESSIFHHTVDTTAALAKQGVYNTITHHHNDVLFGAGSMPQHPGNVLYASLIHKHKSEYRPGRGFKIEHEIIKEVGNRFPPGRFLKQHAKSNWEELKLEEALALTSQALREQSDLNSTLLTTNPVQIVQKGISIPHPHDILVGRGNGANQHPGNVYFRELVQRFKYRYIHTPSSEKKFITKHIINEIRKRNPPGRFLKQNPESDLWDTLEMDKTLEKTSQALRENAPELRKTFFGGLGKPSKKGKQSIHETLANPNRDPISTFPNYYSTIPNQVPVSVQQLTPGLEHTVKYVENADGVPVKTENVVHIPAVMTSQQGVSSVVTQQQPGNALVSGQALSSEGVQEPASNPIMDTQESGNTNVKQDLDVAAV